LYSNISLTIDELKMAITEYIRNVCRAVLNTVFENTVQRVNKCLETGGGDTLNITCNFLYYNCRVHRDFFITLCYFSADALCCCLNWPTRPRPSIFSLPRISHNRPKSSEASNLITHLNSPLALGNL
jgi:hypothetical protein